jgi:hypothetical protein
MPRPALFTPAEANRTLPLVRRIVSDILDAGQHLRELEQSAVAEQQTLQDELRELLAELEGVGCSYRDWSFDVGLVDFPAVIDGEHVLLCWRSDEPQLAYYHGLHAGYAGRKSIPADCLKPATADTAAAGDP